MRRSIKYPLFGVVFLLIWGVILVATTPVQFVLNQIQIPKQIKLDSASGTVWNGRVQLSWQGKQNMKLPIISASRTDLLWQWCPQYGLTTACIQLDNSELQGSVYVSYSPFARTVAIRNTVLQLNVREFPLVLYKVPLTLHGSGEFNVHDMVISVDAPIPETLSINGVLTDVASGVIKFGDYKLDSKMKDDILSISFNGGAENFVVKGRLELEFGKRQYRYFADVKSDDRTLISILKNYASSSGGGKVTFAGAGPFARNWF